MDETQRLFAPPTKKVRDLKEELKKLSDKYIKNFDYPITISGGAVRDTILNYPIRDIDIYINECQLPDFLNLLGIDYTIDKNDLYSANNASEDDKEQYCHLPILRRLNITYRADKLDVLCMRDGFVITAKNIAKLHSVGISQCGLDREGLYRSKLFDKDTKDEMITMTRISWGHAKSMKYFIKLWDKFHWPLRIADKDDKDGAYTFSVSHPAPFSGVSKIIHAPPTIAATAAWSPSWAAMVTDAAK